MAADTIIYRIRGTLTPADKLRQIWTLEHYHLRFGGGLFTEVNAYLGQQLQRHLETLYEYNYAPFLWKDLTDLKKLQLSWLVKIALAKINILPHILYLLQTVPIALNRQFFAHVNHMLSHFIWADQTSRIQWSLLKAPKLTGELNVPNIQAYYLASHLTQVKDWHIHAQSDLWPSMETNWDPNPLTSLLWLLPKEFPNALKKHPLIGTTLKEFIFQRLNKDISPSNGLMTLLCYNSLSPRP